MPNNLVDTITVFRILRKLTTPWEQTKAFKAGVIDKNGKVLIKPKDRTKAQADTISILDRVIFNFKRIIGKIPGGNMQIASYIAALSLIQEHVKKTTNQETLDVLTEKMINYNIIPKELGQYDLSTQEGFMDAFEDAFNEMFSGAAFGGRLSGAGDNNQVNSTGLAGHDPILKSKKTKNIEKIIKNRP